MAKITSPEAAKRLARTIISDIAIYNRQKILDGIKNDNLFDLLKEELDEGYELYCERVDQSIVSSSNYYNNAIVDILVKRSGDIESGIW
ncbi:MAG TPA: hypothetical protein ENJ37_04255 [Deltaproteobacteria bacterium]|nr:hypothetical protein [Deltaproteobacteria bacterium]